MKANEITKALGEKINMIINDELRRALIVINNNLSILLQDAEKKIKLSKESEPENAESKWNRSLQTH